MISEVLKYAMSPGGLITGLLLIHLWTRIHPQSVFARRLQTLVVVGLSTASFWATGYVLSRPLVSRFHPVAATDVREGRTAIVLLGGGHGSIVDRDRREHPTIDDTVVERVAEAARVFKLAGNAVVISSGGGWPGSEWTDASVMRKELVALGVPADRIVLEDQSANTRDQAIRVAGLLPTLRADRVVLVTSELHMVRSVGTFRSVGQAVIPAPASDTWPGPMRLWVAPYLGALSYTSAVIHEYLGIAMYAARGWYK